MICTADTHIKAADGNESYNIKTWYQAKAMDLQKRTFHDVEDEDILEQQNIYYNGNTKTSSTGN